MSIYIPDSGSSDITEQFLYDNFVPNGIFNNTVNSLIPLTGTTQLSGHLVPYSGYSYNLGSSNRLFNTLFTGGIEIKNINGGQTNISQTQGSGTKYLSLPASQGTSGQYLKLIDNAGGTQWANVGSLSESIIPTTNHTLYLGGIGNAFAGLVAEGIGIYNNDGSNTWINTKSGGGGGGFNFNLPNTSGSANNFLMTDGSGNLSWAVPATVENAFTDGGNTITGSFGSFGSINNKPILIKVNDNPCMYLDNTNTNVTFNNNISAVGAALQSVYNINGNKDFSISCGDNNGSQVERFTSSNVRMITTTNAPLPIYPVNHQCPNNTMISATFRISIHCTNGTDFQVFSNEYNYIATNKAGTINGRYVAGTSNRFATDGGGLLTVNEGSTSSGSVFQIVFVLSTTLTGSITYRYWISIINDSWQDISLV
jgi:hypothetical protein